MFWIELGKDDIPFAKILTIGITVAILKSSENDVISKARRIIESLNLRGLVRIVFSFFNPRNAFISELFLLDFL